jgi:hypothetical protein
MMAIGFDCRVHRGGTVAFEKEKHTSFPRIEGGEVLVYIGWGHSSNNRGYDSDLMMLFGFLTEKKIETINMNGFPCLFSVHAGWLRAYGIAIPDDIPNKELLWVEMWDQG